MATGSTHEPSRLRQKFLPSDKKGGVCQVHSKVGFCSEKPLTPPCSTLPELGGGVVPEAGLEIDVVAFGSSVLVDSKVVSVVGAVVLLG